MSYVKSPGGLTFAYMLGGGPTWVRFLEKARGCKTPRFLEKARGCKTPIFMNDVVHEVSYDSIEPLNSATRGTAAPMGVALTAGPQVPNVPFCLSRARARGELAP